MRPDPSIVVPSAILVMADAACGGSRPHCRTCETLLQPEVRTGALRDLIRAQMARRRRKGRAT